MRKNLGANLMMKIWGGGLAYTGLQFSRQPNCLYGLCLSLDVIMELR